MLLTRLDEQLNALSTLVETPEEEGAPPTPTDGDAESSASDSISVSDISSISGEQLPSSPVHESSETDRQDGIADTIGQLYRLSALVKKSRSLQEKTRVDDFIRKEELVETTDDFASYAEWKVEQMFPGTADFLLKRLAAGLVYRQKMLMYRKRHREKLNYGLEAVFEDAGSDGDDQPAPNRDTLTEHAPVIMISAAKTPAASGKALAAPSATNASSIDQVRAKSYPKSVARSRVTASAITSRAQFDVPKPPQIYAQVNEVECPYCSRILTRKDLTPANWT